MLCSSFKSSILRSHITALMQIIAFMEFVFGLIHNSFDLVARAPSLRHTICKQTLQPSHIASHISRINLQSNIVCKFPWYNRPDPQTSLLAFKCD